MDGYGAPVPSGVIDLSATGRPGDGWGDVGWDGFNTYRNLQESPTVSMWEARSPEVARLFLKVYALEPRCTSVTLSYDHHSTSMAIRPNEFPEVILPITAHPGVNTAAISSNCAVDGLRVYKFQIHPLYSPTTPANAVLATGLALLLLFVLFRQLFGRA